MYKINRVVYKNAFIRIDAEDGVAGNIFIGRKTKEIDVNNNFQIRIDDEQEAREVISLIEKGIEYLKTGKVE